MLSCISNRAEEPQEDEHKNSRSSSFSATNASRLTVLPPSAHSSVNDGAEKHTHGPQNKLSEMNEKLLGSQAGGILSSGRLSRERIVQKKKRNPR